MKPAFPVLLALAAAARLAAAPVLGPWTPLFKGIDKLVGTNQPSANFPDLHVAHALRVDLQDPDVSFLATPRYAAWSQNQDETGGMTVSRFVATRGVQVAINAGFFTPNQYYLAENTPMDVDGLMISKGVLVSPQSSADHSAVISFDASKVPRFTPTNWPAMSTAGIQTAVAGSYPLVVHGVNVGKAYINYPGIIHDPNPRTAMGFSQDKRYLYLLAIDGRQPGYSDGADDGETAGWMLALGAYEAINLDGGGSTTMVMRDSTGKAVRLNRSSAVADSGKERTVGAHFGVFAKPLVDFFSPITALPDDTAASLVWTTASASPTQLEYGTTTDLGSSTPLVATPSTNHAVLLAGLQPGTQYYFRAVGASGGSSYTSQTFAFTTLDYASTRELVAMTNTWRYATANLDGANWTAPAYPDSGWSSGAGLLWANNSGAITDGIAPVGDAMPLDPATAFPYVTYYFRTRFDSQGVPPGSSLAISAFVDDGAVFYLNGREIRRLRMDDAPAPISNQTLANAYPCLGDATCSDDLVVDGAAAPLVAGDNVLAVEVHNYNFRSRDITFGLSLTGVVTRVIPPALGFTPVAGGLQLDWTRGGFALQQSDAPDGPWTDVPGPVVAAPYTAPLDAAGKYYRLRR